MNHIILFVSFSSFVVGMYYYFEYRKTSVQYKEEKQKYLYFTVSLLSLSLISICYTIYTNYKSKNDNNNDSDIRKKISHLLLDEKDETNFINYCDRLFQTSEDSGLISQYEQMKSRGNKGEINNLCGNYAKSIIGLK